MEYVFRNQLKEMISRPKVEEDYVLDRQADDRSASNRTEDTFNPVTNYARMTDGL